MEFLCNLKLGSQELSMLSLFLIIMLTIYKLFSASFYLLELFATATRIIVSISSERG